MKSHRSIDRTILRRCLHTIVLAVLIPSAAEAQIADYRMRATDDKGRSGDTARISVLAETEHLAQGWLFGLRHDSSVVQVIAVENGATTATVNDGSSPDFLAIEIYDDGWTAGVIVSFVGAAVLEPARNHELHRADYVLIGMDGDATLLEFSNTLGTPPVATVFPVGGASLAPVTQPGFIEIVDAPFAFHAPSAARYYTAAGAVEFEVTLSAEQYSAPYLGGTGLTVSLAFDTDRLNVVALAPAGPVAALSGGPDFFSIEEFPEGIAGSIIYDTLGGETISLGGPTPFLSVQFQAEIPDLRGDTFILRWADGIGVPFFINSVLAAASTYPVVLRDGYVRLVHTAGAPFIRGDCDRSGSLTIGDAIEVLQHLFSGLAILCRDACDSNGSGTLDIADAMYELSYLFLLGAPPPSPFPDCILVPSALGCDNYDCP